MSEENINKKFRLKKLDEIRNYSIEEINENKLLSKKHKIVVEFWIILITGSMTISITGCVSISAFDFLIAIPTGIMSFVIRLKICAITAGIK